MKTWNIGNTTVRNPARIRDGLEILRTLFEGKRWDEAAQRRFYEELLREGVLETTREALPIPRTRGINGRKWVSAANQLGFCRAWSKEPVRITPPGDALIEAVNYRTRREVFLRQLLKYQLPSPIESGSRYSGFAIKPFRFMLKVGVELHQRGLSGFTKEEIALYVIPTVRNEFSSTAVERIVEYRKERNALKGLVARRQFFGKVRTSIVKELYAEDFTEDYEKLRRVHQLAKRDSSARAMREILAEVSAGGKGAQTKKAQRFVRESLSLLRRGCNVDSLFALYDEMRLRVRGETLWDYADTAGRYASITGLFSIAGDKLVVAEDRMNIVQQITCESSRMLEGDEYLDILYSVDMPVLPTDDEVFLTAMVRELETKRYELSKLVALEPMVKALKPQDETLSALKAYSAELRAEIAEYREVDFYRSQSKLEAIGDIRSYFESIASRALFGGTAYLPAFLEWAVWRVFLAVNQIVSRISDTRGFKIDDELLPIHHAPGGAPDMVFVYSDFTLVCEVTLKTGANQWSAEGEPVPRHVAGVVAKSDRPVYCVFIAPNIHPQTAQQFFLQTYYIEAKHVPLNIVPIRIKDIRALLDAFERRRFGSDRIKDMLDVAVRLKVGCENGTQWQGRITDCFEKWASAGEGP